MLASYLSPINKRLASALNSSVLTYPTTTFNPISLFSGGVQGVWYDPSDLTTMFEDSTGYTAVHTPGNGTADSPVGLLLDKHSGAVGSNGAARYNVLIRTEDFNTSWTSFNTSVTTNTNETLDPLGGNTANKIYSNTASNDGHQRYQIGIAIANSTSYTASVYLKKAEYSWGMVNLYDTTAGNKYGFFDLQNGAVGTVSSGCTASITSVGNGWYLCKLVRTTSSTSGGISIEFSNADNLVSFAAAIGSGIYAWGADLRLTSQAALTPTYQPITSSWAATIAGNHATQSTSTARPTLSAKYNLLTYTEQFDNAAWNKTFNPCQITANAITAPDGTQTADKIYPTLATSRHNTFNSTGLDWIATSYTFSVYAKKGEQTWAVLSPYFGSNLDTWFNLDNGTVGTVSSGNTASITNVGNGWYLLQVTRNPGTSGSANMFFGIGGTTGDGVSSYTGDGVSGIYIWGADIRLTNDGVGIPAYQRVADANTYDSVGFPYYLKFDGADDGLATSSSVNLSGTSKITVFNGIRKLNSSLGCICEFSGETGVNLGSFIVHTNSTGYTFAIQGNNAGSYTSDSISSYIDPITNVGTFISDLSLTPSSAKLSARINTLTPTQSFGDSGLGAGSGNYGNYVLYVGARSGTSLYLQGRLFSLIVRGAASTTLDVSNSESWVNGKTKAY